MLQAHWVAWMSPLFERIRRDPRVLAVMQPLLGPDIRQVAQQIHWRVDWAATQSSWVPSDRRARLLHHCSSPGLPLFLRCARSPGVGEIGAKEHAGQLGPRRCRFAPAARARCRIQYRAGQIRFSKAALCIADGLALGVGVEVLVLDDPARPFTDKLPVEDDDRTVRLVAPGLRHFHHGRGRLKPLFVRSRRRGAGPAQGRKRR
jgi:hypothetical protein